MKKLSEYPGTVRMISHNHPRHTQSVQCFSALQVPAGSDVNHYAAGMDLAKAREVLAQQMVGEWLFFIDDDHVHGPDLLMRLLHRLDENPDVDLVAAFTLRRWPPHYSVIGKLNGPTEPAQVQHVQAGSGLVRVDLTGLGGGAVIRRSAFLKVAPPWFTDGRFTEDWRFCERLKKAGGQAAVDLDAVVGHVTPMAVWPSRDDDGTWGVSYVPVCDGVNQWSETFVKDIVDGLPEDVATESLVVA